MVGAEKTFAEGQSGARPWAYLREEHSRQKEQ